MEWVDKTLVPCMDKSKSEKVFFRTMSLFSWRKIFMNVAEKTSVRLYILFLQTTPTKSNQLMPGLVCL